MKYLSDSEVVRLLNLMPDQKAWREKHGIFITSTGDWSGYDWEKARSALENGE